MKSLFVIPCFYDNKNNIIKKAISNIKKYHENDDIVVVDSGSKDKSYFKFLIKNNVIIEDINNKNYDTGAYWYAFKKYKNKYDFFYFLHDSVIIKANLDCYKVNLFTSVKYFLGHNKLGSRYSCQKRSLFLWNYLKTKINLTRQTPAFSGFDSNEQIEWVNNQFKETKYWLPKTFVALFGPVMMLNKEVMLNLEESGADKILPTNKIEQMAMERVFGIMLAQEGYDITEHTILGDYNNEILENSIISKIILNRK